MAWPEPRLLGTGEDLGGGCSGRPSAGLPAAPAHIMEGAGGLLASDVEAAAHQICKTPYQVTFYWGPTLEELSSKCPLPKPVWMGLAKCGTF